MKYPDRTPAAPINFQATNVGDTSITLTWDPSSVIFDGQSAVTGYDIVINVAGRSLPIGAVNFPRALGYFYLEIGYGDSQYTHSGLNPGDTITYRIYSKNLAGVSTNFASRTVFTDTIPGTPTDFTARSSNLNSIILSWNPPLSDGGDSITGYEVYEVEQSILYAINNNDKALYEIDTNKGTVSRIHATNTLGSGEWESLAIHNGLLYAINSISSTVSDTNGGDTVSGDTAVDVLYTVDPTDGTATRVHATNTLGGADGTFRRDTVTAAYTRTDTVAGYYRTETTAGYYDTRVVTAGYFMTVPEQTTSSGPFLFTSQINSAVDACRAQGGNPGVFDGPASSTVTCTIPARQVWVPPVTEEVWVPGTSRQVWVPPTTTQTFVPAVTRQVFELGDIGNRKSLTSHNGVLYTINNNDDALYTVDTSLGTVSTVHATNTLGSDDWTSLATHNGILYAIGDSTNALYTVDASDGTATRVHSTNTLGDVSGDTSWGALESFKGLLYAIGDTILYTVDVTLGTTSVVHATNTLGSGNWGSLATLEGEGEETLLSSPTSTTYTHTGLSTGDTHIYRVYAVNGIGRSVIPAEMFAVVAAAATIPGSPRSSSGVAATSKDGNSLILSWNTPLFDGGDSITGYEVYEVGDGDTETLLSSPTSTTFTHTGLSAGDTYVYHIYAVNNVGSSASPLRILGNVVTISTVPPGPPTGLSFIVNGSTSITLNWVAPTDTSGHSINGYRIDASNTGDSFYILGTIGDGLTTFTHTGLSAGDTRWYRVYAITDAGTSLTYVSGNATTNSAFDLSDWDGSGLNTNMLALVRAGTNALLYAAAPRGSSGELIEGSLVVGATDGTQATLTRIRNVSTANVSLNDNDPFLFTAWLGTVGTDNTLDYWEDGSGSNLWIQTRAGRISGVTGASGGNYLTYVFSNDIDIKNNIADGELFLIAITTTSALRGVEGDSIPMAPFNLVATAEGDTSIQLNWEAPLYSGRGPVRGYRIEFSLTGTDFITVVPFQEEPFYTHTGLSAGDTIYFRVFSINDTGTSRSWNSVTGYTTSPPPSAKKFICTS